MYKKAALLSKAEIIISVIILTPVVLIMIFVFSFYSENKEQFEDIFTEAEQHSSDGQLPKRDSDENFDVEEFDNCLQHSIVLANYPQKEQQPPSQIIDNAFDQLSNAQLPDLDKEVEKEFLTWLLIEEASSKAFLQDGLDILNLEAFDEHDIAQLKIHFYAYLYSEAGYTKNTNQFDRACHNLVLRNVNRSNFDGNKSLGKQG